MARQNVRQQNSMTYSNSERDSGTISIRVIVTCDTLNHRSLISLFNVNGACLRAGIRVGIVLNAKAEDESGVGIPEQ